MKERHKVVPAVYLLMHNKHGELLLALRQNTGYQDGRWNLPSGHVEAGELPVRALKRETREEIGVHLLGYECILVHTMLRSKYDDTGDRIDLFFKTTFWMGKPRNAEPDKCAEISWFNPLKLPDNMVPHVLVALNQIEDGCLYTELDEDWHKSQNLYLLERAPV